MREHRQRIVKKQQQNSNLPVKESSAEQSLPFFYETNQFKKKEVNLISKGFFTME